MRLICERRGPLDRVDDVGVAGATAQITLQAVRDLVARRARRIGEQLHGGQDHPGRAEAALEAVTSQKASCTGWSCPSRASPSTVVTDAPSACTANSVHDFTALPSIRTVQAPQMVVLAADVRAGETAGVAEEIHEQQTRLDVVASAAGAIDGDRDRTT